MHTDAPCVAVNSMWDHVCGHTTMACYYISVEKGGKKQSHGVLEVVRGGKGTATL